MLLPTPQPKAVQSVCVDNLQNPTEIHIKETESELHIEYSL